MTLAFYLVTKQTQWGYTINSVAQLLVKQRNQGKKCESNKEKEKELGNSVNNLFLLPQLKWEKGKKEKKNEHGLRNTASHKLQGEKEKRMV